MNRALNLIVVLILASTLSACFASPTASSDQLQATQLVTEKQSLGPLTPCSSQEDCPNSNTCLGLSGERCDNSDCDGFCSISLTCSCEDPCSKGFSCLTVRSNIDFSACFPDGARETLTNLGYESIDCDGSNPPDEEDPDKDSDASGAKDGVCIAMDMLKDFASHELVFDKHVVAHVLCDSTGSCATKGHMVNYKGIAMMMGSYCNMVGCEKRIMKVNSPRYQRGLKVASRSQDMHFTAFAAKYSTVAEEAVLAAAVRVGL